ncbi:MAG: phosphoenolpyruvate--protein phosphotransferase [Anaerolineales bacterium]
MDNQNTGKNRFFTGIPASPGIAIGQGYLFAQQEIDIPKHKIQDPGEEEGRLEDAITQAKEEIQSLHQKTKKEISSEEAEIFAAHEMMLEDPMLLKKAERFIHENEINAETAWMDAVEDFAEQIENLDDELFSARAADIRDVGKRVLRILMGVQQETALMEEKSIIIAKDLTPSDTVLLDKELVLGFCTAEGGPTSHTAILAKALGIPAVVGLGSGILDLPADAPLIIQGYKGKVIAYPDPETRQEYQRKLKKTEEQAQLELEKADQPAVTKDNVRVEVVANVGSVEDAQAALEYGAEGIGLLRTEFLYLNRSTAPKEEEQEAIYKEILEVMGDRPVIVRTLDIGGDKNVPYLDLGEEMNPFLGWRAIRIFLDKEDYFKTQLRALLKVSPGHDLRIMFPMIATLEEIRKTKNLIKTIEDDLLASETEIAENIQYGIMVEVPSAVILADQFAKEVDFFSIGTNDLTQYTMAAERTNNKVAHLLDPCHPAILRQIDHVIQAAHEAGIWVGLCGEMAGDEDAVPILLGLDLDEFSAAPTLIPRVKEIIRQWMKEDAKRLARESKKLTSAEEVRNAVREHKPQSSNKKL